MKAPKQESRERYIVPKGLHKAVCISVVDLWTQKEEYKNEAKEQRKLRITRELPEVTREFDWEEKPVVIGKKYTFSMYEKANLAKDIESWFGETQPEDFDFEECVGKSAQINVIHKISGSWNEYAKINSVLSLDEDLEPFNETYLFDLDNFDQSIFDKLPEFMQKDIQNSPEYTNAFLEWDEEL